MRLRTVYAGLAGLMIAFGGMLTGCGGSPEGALPPTDKAVSQEESDRIAKQIEEESKKKKDELSDQLTEALSNILLGEKIPLDVVNSETGEIIIPANRKITKTLLRKLADVYDRIEIDPSPIRNKINEIIGGFKQQGRTVLLTTHYMEEAERLCDRVAIFDAGRVIALGTPAQLIRSLGAEHRIEFSWSNDSGSPRDSGPKTSQHSSG